jgi:hypothetical protein
VWCDIGVRLLSIHGRSSPVSHFPKHAATWRGCAVAVKSLSLGNATLADSVDNADNTEALIDGFSRF